MNQWNQIAALCNHHAVHGFEQHVKMRGLNEQNKDQQVFAYQPLFLAAGKTLQRGRSHECNKI